MKIHTLNYRQLLPLPLDEAWRFFSGPHNLRLITPPWLDFRLTCEPPAQMYAGMILTYRIRPFLRVPVNWVTEITHVNAPFFFVDEQRFGPYRFWHHQHAFRETPGGVEVLDLVSYGLKHGPLGSFTHQVLVRRRLNEIFAFRQRALERMFPTPARARRVSA